MENLPSCMMPDGGPPCKGYEELLAERDALRLKLIETAQELNCMIDLENTRLLQNISATDETPPDYFDAQTVHEAMQLAKGYNTHDKGE